MNVELTLHETRVIGCLIEKEITTPEQYPLSLNALTNACNQRSNRDLALDLDETDVQQVVDGLIKKFHVSEQSGYGSRVPKFQHRFCNTNYGILKFSPQELGIVCELFLRGPQTPGELRSHACRPKSTRYTACFPAAPRASCAGGRSGCMVTPAASGWRAFPTATCTT